MSKRRSSFRDKTVSNTNRQKNRGTQFSYLNLPEGIQQFKEKPESRIELDFLPYEITDPHHPDRNDEDDVATKESLWYKRPIRVHHNVGMGDQIRTIICPSSVGKPCPICEYRAERRQKGADQEEIKKMNYSYRNLYIVKPVNVDDYSKWYKDVEGKPYVWDIAQGNFQKQLNEELWEDADRGIFPDLEEGLTLKIRFSAEIFKTEYAKTSKIEFIKRDKPYKESILDDVPSLDEMLKVLSHKEIEALFFSDEEPEEELKKEEEAPEEHKQHKRERREDEEEEEEEEKPKRDKPKRNKCPHGFEFGTEYDKHKECDECDVWEGCEKEKDNKDDE